jgi:hypothetical protein
LLLLKRYVKAQIHPPLPDGRDDSKESVLRRMVLVGETGIEPVTLSLEG